MQDIDDSRAQGLVHLIKLLPKLEHPPKYMFLENVKNFEVSVNIEESNVKSLMFVDRNHNQEPYW